MEKINEPLNASGQLKKVESIILASGDKKTIVTLYFVGQEGWAAQMFGQLQAGALVDLNYNPDKQPID